MLFDVHPESSFLKSFWCAPRRPRPTPFLALFALQAGESAWESLLPALADRATAIVAGRVQPFAYSSQCDFGLLQHLLHAVLCEQIAFACRGLRCEPHLIVVELQDACDAAQPASGGKNLRLKSSTLCLQDLAYRDELCRRPRTLTCMPAASAAGTWAVVV